MEDEEYVVTNNDSGETLTIEEVSKKFGVMTVSSVEFPSESKEASTLEDEEEEEDEYYFDSKQQCTLSQAKGDGSYAPPEIPIGGRLQFVKISAVGNSRDADDKAYSVYYLDIRCHVAKPSSWFVYRRYSQFRRLSDVLRSEGYFVPVLPPKKLLGTFNTDFVRQRKTELEAWLYNLSQQFNLHPGAKDPFSHPFCRDFLIEGANRLPQPLARVFPEYIDSAMAAESKDSQKEKSSEKATKVGLDDFDLVRVIGKGSFGKVTLVRKKSDGSLFAMKVLSKPNIIKRKQVEHTRTERRVLGSINHPFIVKLHYAFQTDQKLYFVLDYCGGGELFFHLSRMKKFPEHMARFYCAEIALALDALHRIDVVFRDLKPENILLDSEGHVKLADFGLAKEGVHEASEGATSLCGTPEYLSPEVLDRQGHGTAVDWWNLGMVTYEMLTGLPPWYTTDREKLFERLRSAPLKFPFYVNRTAASLIQALLNRNPLLRLGAAGGAEVCAHPFFSSIDWQALDRRQVEPPFKPCRDLHSESDTDNFEKEFTSMPVLSVDEGAGGGSRTAAIAAALSANPDVMDDTFLNFTFEEASIFDSMRDHFLTAKQERRGK